MACRGKRQRQFHAHECRIGSTRTDAVNASTPSEARGTVLVTGGAGFVGTNVSKRLASQGWRVRILDSLARAGSESNINWLLERFPQNIEFVRGDVRDRNAVTKAVEGVEHVYHLAAQV